MNKTEWQVYKRMPQDEFERVGHEIEKLLDKENVNCIDGYETESGWYEYRIS